MMRRITSFAVTKGGNVPFSTNRIVCGTLTSSLPVPITKPASVLPMPVANAPSAPCVHVCESVPKITIPGFTCPFSGRPTWQTPT